MNKWGKLLCAVFVGLWAVSATTQAQLVQVNQRSAATTKFSLSGTAMNTGMLSSFDATHSKVSPSIIGEVTLPVSPVNDTLFGGNKGQAVDDPVVVNNLGNQGNSALVPEPSTWAMILLGAGVLVATMRFRQRRA
jgi:hypothetical protein